MSVSILQILLELKRSLLQKKTNVNSSFKEEKWSSFKCLLSLKVALSSKFRVIALLLVNLQSDTLLITWQRELKHVMLYPKSIASSDSTIISQIEIRLGIR